jgi:hypothetical protein
MKVDLRYTIIIYRLTSLRAPGAKYDTPCQHQRLCAHSTPPGQTLASLSVRIGKKPVAIAAGDTSLCKTADDLGGFESEFVICS